MAHMSERERLEFHTLNHFIVCKRFSTWQETELDLKDSGERPDACLFADMAKAGYFDQGTINSIDTFKINEFGFKRFFKLKEMMKVEESGNKKIDDGRPPWED